MFRIVSYNEETKNAEIELTCDYCYEPIENVDDAIVVTTITRYDGHRIDFVHKKECKDFYKGEVEEVFEDDVVFGWGDVKEFFTDIYNKYCSEDKKDVGEAS